MIRVRVLGIGSPNGDDAVGWLAVEAFQELWPDHAEAGVETIVLDRPGTDLLSHMAGADAVILVDAVAGNAPPGTMEQFAMSDLAGDGRPLSAHGFGVASALELGRTLDMLPSRLVVLGVHVPPPEAGAEMTPGIRSAIPGIARRIASLCQESDSLKHPSIGAR